MQSTQRFTPACAEVTQCWGEGPVTALARPGGLQASSCTHSPTFLSLGQKNYKAAARAALQLIVETGDIETFAPHFQHLFDFLTHGQNSQLLSEEV